MIQIERATPDDVERLSEIKRRAFDFSQGMADSGEFDIDYHLMVMRRGIYYTIIAEGRIVGGIDVVPEATGCYLVNEIFVDPDYQKQGVGGRALQLMEEDTADAHIWTLYSGARSYDNHRFYERLGYVKVEDYRPEDPNGPQFFKFEKHV